LIQQTLTMHHPGIVFHRVKVYSLTADGGWDDTGTGLVSLEPLEVRGGRAGWRARRRLMQDDNIVGIVHLERARDIAGAPAPRARKLTLLPSANAPSLDTQNTTQTHLDDDDGAPPLGLVVLGEENHRTLLVHRVSHEDIYHRQGELAAAMAMAALSARRRHGRRSSRPS
jgi:hypothetical protein